MDVKRQASTTEATQWWADSPSNPTVRVVTIIEHLARYPDRSFGASELARTLAMTKSTCLAILITLTQAGYLIQHPTRRDFRLGPAFVTASRAAQARFPDLEPAHDTIRRVAAQIGSPINVTTVIEDQIVILDVIGQTNLFGGVLRVGVRVPFNPPYGAVHVAWTDASQWDAWLRSANPPLTPDALRTMQRVVEGARRRGYIVTLDLPSGHELEPVQNKLRGSARVVDPTDHKRLAAARLNDVPYFLEEVKPRLRYQIGQIQAPVLSAPLREPLALSANWTGDTLTGAEVVEAAECLQSAAAVVATEVRRR